MIALQWRSQAEAAIAGFLSRIRRGRPLVRLKVAASVDGRTAMASGESKWVTGTAARAEAGRPAGNELRHRHRCETVLVDDPALTVRDRFAHDGTIRQPTRIVLDSNLRVPATAKLFSEPGRVADRAHDRYAVNPKAEHLKLSASDGRVDLAALVTALAERPCNEVLVEAGPTLIGAFLKAGLWDELLLYVAPKFLGSDARRLAHLPIARMLDAIEAKIAHRDVLGGDLRLRLIPA